MIVYNDGKLFLRSPYAFSSKTVKILSIGGGVGARNGTVDLGGYDQSIGRLIGGSDASCTYKVTSATPAVLHVDTSVNMDGLTVVFQGGAGFDLNAATAEQTASFVRASSTTGTLAVTRGKLTLNAKWASAKTVTVGAEGELTLAVAAAFGLATDVRVTEGGLLNVAAGCDCTVKKLTLPGIGAVTPGEWGSAESGAENQSAALGGTGKLYVMGEKSTATWTGAGSGTSLSEVANWQVGGTVPESVDVTSGGLVATFGDGGAQATADFAARFCGLVLTLPSFTFLQSGTGTFALGADGLVTTASDTARTYTFKPAVKVVSDQSWTVASGNKIVLDGGLKGANRVSKSGAGDIVLNVAGDLSGKVVFTGGGRFEINADRVDFPMDVTPKDAGETDPVVVREACRTVFGGLVQYGGSPAIKPPAGATVEYAGGFSGTVKIRPNQNGGKVVFSGGAVSLNGGYFDSGCANGIEFATENITSTAFNFYNGDATARKTLACTVPWALKYEFTLNLGYAGQESSMIDAVTLDISGGDQGVRCLSGRKVSVANKPSVWSSGDAVLHAQKVTRFNQADVHGLYAIFEGGAGFSCETDATHTNTVESVNTSTGRVCVASGTLTFAEGASWANAGKVCVSGGRLILPRQGIIANRSLEVELTGGALELARGVVLRAKSVSVGGATYEQGTVGGIGSGADHETSLIEGDGMIRLKCGLALIVR